jgi:hypothetical protein
MKLKQLLVLPAVCCLLSLTPAASGQTDESPAASPNPVDDRTLDKQLAEREEKIGQLTVDEQLKLRAAEVKASEDIVVLEALQKRNAAIMEFRDVLRAAVLRADPSVAPILDKIAVGDRPGF